MQSKNGKKASGKTAPWLKTLAIILTLSSAVPQAEAVVAVEQNSLKLPAAETTKNLGKSPKEIAKLDFETLTSVPEKSDISQSIDAKQKEGENSFESEQNSDEKMSHWKMEPIGGSTKSVGSNDAMLKHWAYQICWKVQPRKRIDKISTRRVDCSRNEAKRYALVNVQI